jgi:hypothetical protein
MINLQSIAIFLCAYFLVPRLTFLPPIVRQLSPLLGPIIIPRLINFINTFRATSASRRVPIRPVPPKVQRGLNILFVAALASLIATAPQFAPENIFQLTQSRLQISPDVLFARLRLLRPLTPDDEVLYAKFKASSENRLAYLAYGPDTVVNCTWCTTANGGSDANNFLIYSFPKLITPHIWNLAVLGLATSSVFVGPEGARFRIHATIAGLGALVAESWYLAAYDIAANKRSTRLEEVDFAFWNMRIYRYVGFAFLHALLGLVLWATSTNRWLATPPSLALRLESASRVAEESVNKLRALGLLANSVNRDAALRGVKEEYWQTEGRVMSEVVQDDEVVGEINRVVAALDLKGLEGQAATAADAILKGIDDMGAGSGGRAAATGTTEPGAA